MNKNIKSKFVLPNNIRFVKIIVIISYFFLYSVIFLFVLNNNNYFNRINAKLMKNDIILDEKTCNSIKNELKKRTRPLDYEKEFIFFTSLISCKIPFSFIRFADGEEHIMSGKYFQSIDVWHWSPHLKNLRDSLIESANICLNPNNFIAIPCKNWIEYSKSILSYSKCNSSKYMSYATLFYNKNYLKFKEWITSFINSSNRWDIILVANSKINKNISWAYKFYPIPDNTVEIWDEFKVSLLSNLSNDAKKDNIIFFISAGPTANIIISYLSKINNKNIYIDFGSAIEFITKGYSTRKYSKKTHKVSNKGCESFIIRNKNIIYDE